MPLRGRRAMLAVPSPAIASMVRHDPLGLYDLLREQLGGAQAGINLGVTEGGYVASDLRSRLLIAKPVQPPFDADFSRALMTRLDALRGEMGQHAARTGDGGGSGGRTSAAAGSVRGGASDCRGNGVRDSA